MTPIQRVVETPSREELFSDMAARLDAIQEQADLQEDPAKYLDFFPYTPWYKQKEIIRSTFDNKITLVRSCNNVGKTHTIGQIILAWLDIHRYDAKVITTAKNFDSVRFMLWTRVRTMYKHVRPRFGNTPINQTDFQPDPTEWPEWFAVGYNPKIEGDEAVAFQGHHARHILFVIDEAILTPPAIWKAMEGSLVSEGAHLLAVYNPTTTEGSEVYQMEKEGRGNLITVSAWDLFNSPEYKEDPERYVNLTSPAGVQELIDTYGKDSPIVRSRVDGEWPESDDDNAIKRLGLAWAKQNYDDPSFNIGPITKLSFGWDVAGDGADSNVLGLLTCGKYGMRYEQVKRWGNLDHAKSLSRVWQLMQDSLAAAEEYNAELEAEQGEVFEPIDAVLVVDAVGEGSHVKSILDTWDTEARFGINSFKGGAKPKKFHQRKEVTLLNANSEAWYRLNLLLMNEIPEWEPAAIQMTPELEHQLATRKKYWGAKNKEPLVWYLEPKQEWSQRNRGKSPDEADACVMAFYGYYHGGGSRIRMLSVK